MTTPPPLRTQEPTPGTLTLDVGNVGSFLVDRGVTVPGDFAVERLSGGVSGTVLLVESGERRWVVKQALGRLLTKAIWEAKPERASTEAAAIDLLHRITPRGVPQLIDLDDVNHVVTMTAAPSTWIPWKSLLLSSDPKEGESVRIAAELGSILASWHRGTWSDPEVAKQFHDSEAFEQLRLLPFHRTIAERHPELRRALDVCIADLSERSDCLVHGDFSPKNVLIGQGDLWVLDFEVAKVGAAVFDVAFLLGHLAVKAVARVASAGLYRGCAEAFLHNYLEGMGPTADLPRLVWQVAAIMLARVDGLSPVDYLDDVAAERVRTTAIVVLTDEGSSTDSLWDLITERLDRK